MAHRNNYIVSLVILIVALFPTSFSLPRHRDLEYTEGEPEAIPMHLLRIPMQVDVPSSQIEDFPDFSHPFKRANRNHLSSQSEFPKSCCPTNREIVEPMAGKNRAGDLVELYQTESVRQRFYEISCAPSTAERPCRFLDKEHKSLSKCEQQYSFTYALVRDMSMDGSSGSSRNDRGWRLDYILIRSGCSCRISSGDD